MTAKRITAIIIALAMLIFAFTGCVKTEDIIIPAEATATKAVETEAPKETAKPVATPEPTAAAEAEVPDENAQAIEAVISNFKKLAEIPRPSGYEKNVSGYLYSWAQTVSENAKQDSVKNIIADIPASEGLEDKPLTVLQCHMDMVAVAEQGYDFDPLKDSIKVIREGDELKAEHTSLGGDDGIGIAIAQYIAENNEKHGPLRIIFTVDEEKNQTGAFNLNAAYIEDADYLINIDWEKSDEVCVTSAAFVSESFSKKGEWVKNPYNNPVELRVEGGLGGHSGENINSGTANANVVLADLLTALKAAGVRYCLASFEGGSAVNAIAPYANAVITVHEKDNELLSETVERFNEGLSEKYMFTDPDIHVEEMYPNLLVRKVLSEKELNNVLLLLTNLISGVYTMSPIIDDFVESSGNVGIVKISEDGCSVAASVRSSESYPMERIVNANMLLAEALGFEADAAQTCSYWPYDPDNPLITMAADVYREQNGEEITVSFTHAGLECGEFGKMSEKLNMISVGPDVNNAHTPNETITVSSIGKTLGLIEGILAKIAEE